MPTLGSYSRKPQTYTSPPQPPVYTLPSLLELSYGPRTSFAPTYDSGSSAVTRSDVDGIVARRMRAGRALGPPPVLASEVRTDKDKDAEMSDAVTHPKPASSIHPDLIPVIDPALAPESASPATPSIVSKLDPSLDPDTITALDAAFQELALEESVRGLLESNAKAMTALVDMQNDRLQRWDSRKPDLSLLDGKGEELELGESSCVFCSESGINWVWVGLQRRVSKRHCACWRPSDRVRSWMPSLPPRQRPHHPYKRAWYLQARPSAPFSVHFRLSLPRGTEARSIHAILVARWRSGTTRRLKLM